MISNGYQQALLVACLVMLTDVALGEQPATRASAKTDSSWKPLFNGRDFEGWYTILEDADKNQDPTNVYQVHDGVIHLYKDHPEGRVASRGYFATQLEYSHFHLRFEYKWGTKKFEPRYSQPRDAGCLYHLTGPDAVWPRCIECQVQQGDTGDCLALRGSQLDTTVDPAFSEVNTFQFRDPKDGGVLRTIGNAQWQRIIKASIHELDDWNTVEVIVRGSDEALHIVNGHMQFRASNLQQPGSDGKSWDALTHGRIAFQAECAEVLYRNIELRPIEGELHPR